MPRTAIKQNIPSQTNTLNLIKSNCVFPLNSSVKLIAGVVPGDEFDGATDADIKQVSADGAYDKWRCYDALIERQSQPVIPPQKNAKIWQHSNCKAPPHPRDENLR